MGLITTNSGRIVLKKAASMMVLPYVYNSTIGDYVFGTDVYDISAVIGDSITIEQSEGSTTTKENEFVAAPLLECVSGGKYGFTAQCIDLQNTVLKSCFNAMTISGENGAVALQDDYTLLYALIRVRFEDTSLPDVFLPKVQMNSKLLISQLKTRLSQGNLSGSARSVYVAIANADGDHALSFVNPMSSQGVYTPYTPVLFVPQNKTPLFFYKKTATTDVYALIDFNSGVVVPEYGINSTTGVITEL